MAEIRRHYNADAMATTPHRPQDAHAANGYASLYVSAQDGLKLHVRHYGPRPAAGVPVLCLAGLSRTSADFHDLATALAATGRRVLALDYRGRGRSDFDRDPRNYSLPVELSDVAAVLTALEAAPAVVVGTSRGGILAMLLAAWRPTLLAACVLNDIGPVIEPQGLMRIKGYLGKLPPPKDYADAADILRRMFGAQFPAMTAPDWLAHARRTYREADGRLVPDHDTALATALAALDLERPLPTLWNEFGALARRPVMAIRGGHSDILSAATLAEMRVRRRDLEVVEVEDQGHAPWLTDAATISRIVAFVQRCDERAE